MIGATRLVHLIWNTLPKIHFVQLTSNQQSPFCTEIASGGWLNHFVHIQIIPIDMVSLISYRNHFFSTLWVYKMALPGILVCHFVHSELGTATFQQGATTHVCITNIIYSMHWIPNRGPLPPHISSYFTFIAFNCLWPSGSISTRSNTFIFWGYGLYKMEL